MKSWLTMHEDMQAAEKIMAEYAAEKNLTALGLFEVMVNANAKKMDLRVSPWIVTLAKYFKALYGESDGDQITRKVLSRCIIKGETIH